MDKSQAILEQQIADRWVARTIESYPAQIGSRLRSEDDPFRNPVGHALKENLVVLVRELLGGMNPSAIAGALDSIIRIRAVQDFTPADAVRFIFDLRLILHDVIGGPADPLQNRIDSLALAAFDKYMSCREQIFALRSREMQVRAHYAAQ